MTQVTKQIQSAFEVSSIEDLAVELSTTLLNLEEGEHFVELSVKSGFDKDGSRKFGVDFVTLKGDVSILHRMAMAQAQDKTN